MYVGVGFKTGYPQGALELQFVRIIVFCVGRSKSSTIL